VTCKRRTAERQFPPAGGAQIVIRPTTDNTPLCNRGPAPRRYSRRPSTRVPRAKLGQSRRCHRSSGQGSNVLPASAISRAATVRGPTVKATRCRGLKTPCPRCSAHHRRGVTCVPARAEVVIGADGEHAANVRSFRPLYVLMPPQARGWPASVLSSPPLAGNHRIDSSPECLNRHDITESGIRDGPVRYRVRHSWV